MHAQAQREYTRTARMQRLVARRVRGAALLAHDTGMLPARTVQGGFVAMASFPHALPADIDDFNTLTFRVKADGYLPPSAIIHSRTYPHARSRTLAHMRVRGRTRTQDDTPTFHMRVRTGRLYCVNLKTEALPLESVYQVFSHARMGSFVYMHACMHTYMHTYIFYLHAYIHAYVHAYVRTCIHTYMHTYIHTCIHACMHTHTHTYTHTHAHTHTHTQPTQPLRKQVP